MVWKKESSVEPGQLEFHLPADRSAAGVDHDEEWRRARAEKLARRRHA